MWQTYIMQYGRVNRDVNMAMKYGYWGQGTSIYIDVHRCVIIEETHWVRFKFNLNLSLGLKVVEG